MDARLPSRRTLLSTVVLAGAAALTGCSSDDADANSHGAAKPSPTPSTTDESRLHDGPPAAASASARSSAGAWRYTHLPDAWDGSYQALAVTSRDDVWALRAMDGPAGGKPPATLVLDHWEGRRWREKPLPEGISPQAPWSLAASGHGTVWLARLPSAEAGAAAYHWDGSKWRTLPAPPVAGGQDSSGGTSAGPWLAAAGARLWLCLGGKTAHWDGHAWSLPQLPFQARAVTAAPAEGNDDTPLAWVVGSVDTDCHGDECYPQPASARWEGRGWRRTDTPEYRFPNPVPPEAAATLDTVVHDPDHRRTWALGRGDFNHGEVDEEPRAEAIALTGTDTGDGWTKHRLPHLSRGLSTSTTVPDGTGSLLLDTRNRLTGDGKVRRLHDPERLAEPSEVPKSERKYDFGQPMECLVARLVPGTRTVLAAGGVRFPNSGTKDTPLRPMLARYDADGED